MDCIAHRGFPGVNPENTVAAVADAATRADGVEVDVRVCNSGELVVCHDETVDRTTDGSGPVSARTAEELAALSVEGSDQGVPTFEAVVEAIPYGVTLNAELKERGTAEGVERIVSDADCDAFVSSFDPEALSEVAELPTALVASDPEGTIERASELDCFAVGLRLDAWTPELVGRAHGAGLTATAWTVTDVEETRRLREMNVDAVITDFPECCPS
jgi:glycerophosphoryl diester phosphodiesterase